LEGKLIEPQLICFACLEYQNQYYDINASDFKMLIQDQQDYK